MALLEFLARPAPAGVVAPDLLDLGHAALLDGLGEGLGVALLPTGGLGQRAGLARPGAARVGHASRARRRARGRVLLLGCLAVLALALNLDLEAHPREVQP